MSVSSTLTSETHEGVPELIDRLKQEHATADALCKHVQAFRKQAGIPAINELRYAGYHVTLALPEPGSDFDQSHLLKAISHAQRATYEAAEAGILTCLDHVELFKQDYRLVPITDVLPDWVSISELASEAQTRLRSNRQTGSDRQLDHRVHKDLFDRLVAAVGRLDAARSN